MENLVIENGAPTQLCVSLAHPYYDGDLCRRRYHAEEKASHTIPKYCSIIAAGL